MYHFIVWVLQIYGLLALLTGLAILNLWRKRRESRSRLFLLSIPFALLFLLSLPVSRYLALGSLEWRSPPSRETPTDADAIVVLGGYLIPPDEATPKATLGEDTLYRCLEAVEVYKRLKTIPVLVSGGKVHPETPGPPLARAMGEFLVAFGVRDEDVVIEDRSRTTHENAIECGKILRRRGFRKIILVTDAAHLERAARCFRRESLSVARSGCRYRATQLDRSVSVLIPNPDAARGCLNALHEWVGIAWYWMRGWA